MGDGDSKRLQDAVHVLASLAALGPGRDHIIAHVVESEQDAFASPSEAIASVFEDPEFLPGPHLMPGGQGERRMRGIVRLATARLSPILGRLPPSSCGSAGVWGRPSAWRMTSSQTETTAIWLNSFWVSRMREYARFGLKKRMPRLMDNCGQSKSPRPRVRVTNRAETQ